MLNNPVSCNEGTHNANKEKPYNSSDFCLECNINERKCLNCLQNEAAGLPVNDKNTNKIENEKERKTSTPAGTPPTQKQKRYRPNYICTAYCRYDIIRQIASKFGMRESQDNWNILWSDYYVPSVKFKSLKSYQKINHFPGIGEICRKDLLARNLNRMCKLFPEDYDFFPKTWILPVDVGEVSEYARKSRNATYILKPDMGCKGKGIQLTKNTKDLASFERTICQVYVSKPYLIDGFKFDLRIYVLITSCDPLRLYVYNEGLVRFATKHYKEPNKVNISNMFMHLTNYSVNKFSRTYIVDPEEGSKRKLTTFNEYLRRQSHDVVMLWQEIDDVIIKTVLLALPTLQHNFKAIFPGQQNRQPCFELLGFDLILDSTLKPYLLEVNQSPSFHTDAPIDREVKEALIMDTFKILNLSKNTKNSVMLEDKRDATNRLLKVLENSPNNSALTKNRIKPCSSEEKLKKLEEYEEENCGNYRKIYPNNVMMKYSKYFCQGTSSFFNETFASRARERVSKLMKEGSQESDLELLKPFEPIVNHFVKRPLPESLKIKKEINERIASHKKICEEMNGTPSLSLQKSRVGTNFSLNDYYNERFPDITQKDSGRSLQSDFDWEVHFGISKKQFKIDSFPSGIYSNSSRVKK